MAVATQIGKWTLAELHRLPEDGNKYELVRGELFVTPPPTDKHETILAQLTHILDPYVHEHRLGLVYHPKAVMRFKGSEVEPDLMVRQRHPNPRGNDKDWDAAPIPILVVEILSDHTRRRDLNEKKAFYLEAGVADYWVVDSQDRTVRTFHRGGAAVETRQLAWHPVGASVALIVDVDDIFV